MAHVLLVDPVTARRRATARHLRSLGHRPVLAEDAAEALALFDRAEFDLVLSELLLEGPNGFDLLDQVLRRVAERVPVVFLTAHDDPQDLKTAIYAGAFDYVLAPAPRAVLEAVVAEALQHRRLWQTRTAQRALQARTPHDAPTPAA